MSKLLTYLKYEGIGETLRKCISAVFGKGKNTKETSTVFLSCGEFDIKSNPDLNLEPVVMTPERVEDFEKVRFFDHVSAASYLNAPSRKILLGYVNGEIVSYAAMEYGVKKEIHGFGWFQLDKDEAWIGPVYVKRSVRGKGINKEMIRSAMALLTRDAHIHKIYTCINGGNSKSLHSFKGAGFHTVGEVNCADGQYVCLLDEDVAHKFSAPDDPAKLDRH